MHIDTQTQAHLGTRLYQWSNYRYNRTHVITIAVQMMQHIPCVVTLSKFASANIKTIMFYKHVRNIKNSVHCLITSFCDKLPVTGLLACLVVVMRGDKGRPLFKCEGNVNWSNI